MDTTRTAKTTPKPDTTALDAERFGQRLRSLRKEKGWTLVQLAARSGVSITTISRAERGLLALGYDNITGLGQALQMDMGAMFAAPGTGPQFAAGPVVTRAGQGVRYQGAALTYEFLGTPTSSRHINPGLAVVHARSFNGPQDFVRHAGEEFAYVLSGQVDVYFETGEQLRLGRGDALFFDSGIGHAYVSVGRALAQLVGVVSSESAFIQSARGALLAPVAKAPGRRPRRSA